MNNRRAAFFLVVGITLSVVALVGITWANYQFVTRDEGMNAFLPAWGGTRWFMVKGWSPYSQDTLQQAQQIAYGRLAREDEEKGFFLYPIYSVLIFAPFGLFGDYLVARALWMTVLELALLGIVGLGIHLSEWQPARWLRIPLYIFVIVWYFSIRSILSGDTVILSTLFIVLAFLAIRAGQDALAGFLWVLASIHASIMLLLTIFLLLWAVSHRRWSLLSGVVLNFIFIVAVISLLIPDWAIQFARQIVAYAGSTFHLTPGNVLAYWLPGVGRQVGQALTIVVVSTLIWEWREAWGKDFRWFFWAANLTLVGTNLIGIPTSLENYVGMLPALVLVLATWNERWGRLGRVMIGISILLLSVGVWAMAIGAVRKEAPLELDPGLFLFVPIFMLAGLYWVRRWAIRPPRMFLEALGRHIGGMST